MPLSFSEIASNDFSQFREETNNMTTQVASMKAVMQNISLPDGCPTVVVSEMDFLPWDNPDNIVSAEVESFTRRFKDIILVFLFLIGGPGNVINMAVFYKQGLKDRVNLCLFFLSLADEVYLIAAMCHFAEQVHLQFTTTERYGPMITFLTNHYFPGFLGFLYVSPVLTAVIASERCYCVLRPLKYQSLMRTRTMAVIVASVYILVVGPYFIVAFRFYVGCIYNPVTGEIAKGNVIGDMYKKYKGLVDSVDSYIYGISLPAVVMVVVITTTAITVGKLRQIVAWRSEASSTIPSREVALTKMLVGTSVLFIICIFPLAVTRISWQFFPEINAGRRNHNLFLTGVWINEILTYINSSFNICVYYVMGSRYRETVWELFSRKHASRSGKDSSQEVPVNR